jgi:FAD/FMN-containing dehydrogenase
MASINGLGSLEDSVLVLPPDVSASAFREVLLEMAKVVGNDNVTVHTRQSMKPDEQGHYYNLPKEHDLFYVLEKEHFLAGAVVCPGSTEEVSAVVKLANKYLAPLWPVSIGRNLGKSAVGSHG